MDESTVSERERILEGLRSNREAWRAERDRHDATTYELRQELLALLEQGIEAGLGRRAMSKAVEMNLPSLSSLLDSIKRS